jgi:anti-anti-sigma regulatory factor
MAADRHVDLDLRDPAWAENADTVLKSVLEGAPPSLTVLADAAPAPSARAAQMLLVLRRHAEARGGTFSVPSPSPAFRDGLRLIGLHDLILDKEVAHQ